MASGSPTEVPLGEASFCATLWHGKVILPLPYGITGAPPSMMFEPLETYLDSYLQGTIGVAQLTVLSHPMSPDTVSINRTILCEFRSGT